MLSALPAPLPSGTLGFQDVWFFSEQLSALPQCLQAHPPHTHTVNHHGVTVGSLTPSAVVSARLLSAGSIPFPCPAARSKWIEETLLSPLSHGVWEVPVLFPHLFVVKFSFLGKI